MKNIIFNSLVAVCVVTPSISMAQGVPTQYDYHTLPRVQQTSATPLVMLALSNDHQLYFKAYTDYDDLNGNGELDGPGEDDNEITYNNSRPYDGYFSSDHCYAYSGGVFSISSAATGHYCTGANEWSGNFLNWATMTRIDLLRHVLYGGKRSTDTASATILERSYLPNDAHSFAKYYNGSDLSNLTPISSSEGITICNTTLHLEGANQNSRTNTSDPLMRVIKGNYSLWASGERFQCLVRDNGAVDGMEGYPNADGVPRGVYHTAEGLKYDENHQHGLAVIADHVEVFEDTFEDFLGDEFVKPKTNSPHVSDFGDPGEGDYIVRIEACPSTYLPSAGDLKDCKRYGVGENAIYKPTGVLQKFGEDGSVYWGLISGSYLDNKKAGYLRRNIGNFSDEVNAENGTFTGKADGIVANIDAFRIVGWNLLIQADDGWYGYDGNPDNYDGIGYNEFGGGQATNQGWCRWGRKGFDNGHCVDWGNPLGEILAESYRYFSGLDGVANEAIVADYISESATKAPVGLNRAKWTPITDNAYQCSKLNVLGLNTSAQTYDREVFEIANGIPGVTLELINSQTDSLLDSEVEYLYGRLTGEQDAAASCRPKSLDNLSQADGACPEAPGHQGTWVAAGLAKIVSGRHTTDAPVINGQDSEEYDVNDAVSGAQQITTHGLQLASALPQVKIPYDGRSLTITPMCESWGDATDENNREFLGNCGLVDFQVLSLSETEGVVYINWEDSEQGGDYDQDMQGLLKYEVENSTLTVTTKVIGQSTIRRLGFGYILSGLGTDDGVYVHSGINGYPGADNYRYNHCNDETATVYNSYQNRVEATGRRGCGIDNEASEETHTIDAASIAAEKLPTVLNLAAEASGGEYVNVNNPDNLSAELESIVMNLSANKPIGSSEIAASGISAGGLFLHTLSYPQKELDGQRVQWIGQVGALRVDEENRLRDADNNILEFVKDGNASRVQVIAANGGESTYIDFDQINYFWSTTDTLAAQTNRRIYTALVEPDGDDFVETNLVRPQTLTEFVALDDEEELFLAAEGDASELVGFIRGVESDNQRSRTLSGKTYLLGDIQTSPVVQSVPDYSYASELGDASYQQYINAYKNARNIVYVASNDGMIHAINGGTKNNTGDGFIAGGPAEGGDLGLGEELWAYIPFNLLPHLQWLAREDYAHVPYFDGYMRTFDIKAWGEGDAVHVGGWGTILVVGTGMGAGHFPISLDDNPNDAEVVTKPAYIVLDITNRNATQPTLIAEISHEQLGFTTAEPDVIRRVVKSGDSETSEWYLVFGSGPRADDDNGRRSAQTTYTLPAIAEGAEGDSMLTAPYLFSFKLGASDAELTATSIDVAGEGAFIGAINGMDWNRDFIDDVIYFGTIAGDQTNPTGQLLRATLGFSGGLSFTPSIMYNTDKPVVARPVTVINQRDHWVFAGTGRYYVREDADQDHNGNMYLGIKEDIVNGSISGKLFTVGDLFSGLDGIEVDTGGNLYTAEGDVYSLNNVDMPKIDNLRNHIKENTDGWLRSFGNSNQRQHTQAGYLASTLFVGTTEPGASDGCSSSDRGRLYVWDMRSGVPSPYVTSHTKKFSVNNSDTPIDVIDVPIVFDGAAPAINDPASQLMNLADGSVADLPELDLNIPSQRHSWREVTIPW